MLDITGLVLGASISNEELMLSLVNGTIKLFFLLAFGLYLTFAFIVTRQVSIMQRTLTTTFTPFIQFLGWTHFFLALVLFIWIFFI